jgi:hypothetical protein
MNYTRPEIAVLGNAISLIEMTGGKGTSTPIDSLKSLVNPAYDLDE